MGKISIITGISDDKGKFRYTVVIDKAGTVDYTKGEILLNTIQIFSTVKPNRIVEVQAYPTSNDVIGLKETPSGSNKPITLFLIVCSFSQRVHLSVKFGILFYIITYNYIFPPIKDTIGETNGM